MKQFDIVNLFDLNAGDRFCYPKNKKRIYQVIEKEKDKIWIKEDNKVKIFVKNNKKVIYLSTKL